MAMLKSRYFLALPTIAAAMIVVAAAVATRGDDQPQNKKQSGKKVVGDEIIQEFPGAAGENTAWKVRYQAGKPRPGLLITGAWFKTGPSAEWFPVLGEIRLSEVFVPYNDGTTRLYDIGAQGSYDLLTHTATDAGANGRLLNDGLVVKEVRDTGVLWKYYDKVRRGQELVLWSTIGATNYNYLVEYAFRCDGTVTCKLGSTGKNLGSHETMGHLHHSCWRIDMNVGDKDHNSVAVVRRVEAKDDQGKAEDMVSFLKTEGGVEWKAEEFTRLRVESNRKNGQGNPIAYELVPQRPGTPRHFGREEGFSEKDFWVTPYQFDELYYCHLPGYVKAARNVADTDVVVWYMAPAYHLPRDEDGIFVNPRGDMEVRGVALTTWCGLEMRPRNLFEKSPLFP
jgi:Cu2+-containing amine oxidase